MTTFPMSAREMARIVLSEETEKSGGADGEMEAEMGEGGEEDEAAEEGRGGGE